MATEHAGRVLDWRPHYDERSRNYGVAAVLERTTLPTTGKLWATGPVLDQGREGACVGYGISGEAAAEPVPVPGITAEVALSVYRRAQHLDDYPGESYEGTSVLAGCLAARERGWVSGFRWAFRAEEVCAAIVQLGPVVAGVEWTADSYETDELGVLRAGGDVVGGHCVVLVGYVPAGIRRGSRLCGQLQQLGLWRGYLSVGGPALVMLNSWGESFGVKGLAIVPLDVLRSWVKTGGEFAIPEGRALGKSEPARAELIQPATAGADRTLLPQARELQDGDRIVEGLPDQLEQSTATVHGRPRRVAGAGGEWIRVRSTAGVFTLRASARVKIRRPVA